MLECGLESAKLYSRAVDRKEKNNYGLKKKKKKSAVIPIWRQRSVGLTNEENETKEAERSARGHRWLLAEEGQRMRPQVGRLPVQHSLASDRIKKPTQRQCSLDNRKGLEKWSLT